MPTIFTHAIAASALGALYHLRAGLGPHLRPGRRAGGGSRSSPGSTTEPPRGQCPGLPRGFWVLTALCAILPDADVVAFDLGLDYGHMLGHRGLSHSLLFAVGIGALMAVALGRGTYGTARLSLFLYFSLVTASHGLLDAFTDEGLGVAFLAPFSGERYFFPWRPLEVAPIGGHGFFTAREVRGGLRWVEVLWSEVRWVWIPAAAVALAARQLRRIGRAPG